MTTNGLIGHFHFMTRENQIATDMAVPVTHAESYRRAERDRMTNRLINRQTSCNA